MSMFGSRKKTFVATSVSRAIEDDMLPNSIRMGFATSLHENNNDAIGTIIGQLGSSIGLKMGRMYNYGRDHYTWGLPSSTQLSSVAGKAVVENAVEAAVGGDVQIEYTQFGKANLLHMGWLVLVRDYGYDSTTNTLQFNNKSVFLSDMQVVVNDASLDEMEAGSFDVWGTPPNAGPTPQRKYQIGLPVEPSKFIVNSSAMSDHVKVTVCYETTGTKVVENVTIPSTTIVTDSFVIPLTEFNLDLDYHQVKYTKNGKDGYWIYRVGSNVNQAIEDIFETQSTDTGTYFPWAYFRYDKQAQMVNNGSAAFNTTNKLLAKLGMDFEEVGHAIHENPDIGDVEQSFLMAAVPANSQNELEQRYLFDFFKIAHQNAIAQQAATSSNTAFKLINVFTGNRASSTLVIQDKRFKMSLSWNNIVKKRVAGNIGAIGSHTAGFDMQDEVMEGLRVNGQPVIKVVGSKTHKYRKQITENIYEEIEVSGLELKYHIWGDYAATGDENDSILLIPLDIAITSQYSLPDKEELYARSLHYVFNSRVIIKLKWYQTGIFRIVLVIIAIIITIITLGAGWQSIGLALGVGAIVNLLITVVITAIINALIKGAMKLLTKWLGDKAPFIILIMAIFVAIYTGDTTALSNLPWGQILVNLVSNMVQTKIKNDFDALEQDRKDFEELAETKLELLENAMNLLDSNVHLAPLIIFGERPDDFFQRTIHSGNIGVAGIEVIESYVDLSLRLPELYETIGVIS